MALEANVEAFMKENTFAVLSAFRKSGAAQLSVVNTGSFRDGVAFTTTSGRAKLNNLRRDPRFTLLAVSAD